MPRSGQYGALGRERRRELIGGANASRKVKLPTDDQSRNSQRRDSPRQVVGLPVLRGPQVVARIAGEHRVEKTVFRWIVCPQLRERMLRPLTAPEDGTPGTLHWRPVDNPTFVNQLLNIPWLWWASAGANRAVSARNRSTDAPGVAPSSHACPSSQLSISCA